MPGQINWMEIPVADTGKGRAFYGSLFGWGSTEFGEGTNYHMITDGPLGAITLREENFTHPRVYFATDDIKESLKKTVELGGQVKSTHDIPGGGCFAHCADDQGTPFSLYQEPAAKD